KPIWQHHQEQKNNSKFEFIQIGLKWPRDTLYKNINERVDRMINDGFVNEIQSILNDGYDKNLNSLNTVGYKEIISHLEDEITLERAIELIKRNTRHYAKRQLTWFNADDRIKWYSVSSKAELYELIPSLISIF
ncbi:MAG: tRNA dimethylallyltransferase, partial [Ignavibacteria bacterium]